MQINKELQKLLTGRVTHYQDTAELFKIKDQTQAEMQAATLALAYGVHHQGEPRKEKFSVQQDEYSTQLLLTDNATAEYFHASGYKLYERNVDPFENVVSEDASKFDAEAMKAHAGAILETAKLDLSGPLEKVQFEKLWQLKASGISYEGKQGRVVINRLVYAYRRFLLGLPVWGGASISIKTASKNVIDSFGIDWRSFDQTPLDKNWVIAPDDAAIKVLDHLQSTNPGKVFTPDDFEVESFDLGYLSQPKRKYQTVLQPVWMARLVSKGPSGLGHAIAVTATDTAYEPIQRTYDAPVVQENRNN